MRLAFALTLVLSLPAAADPMRDFLRAHAETRGFMLGRPTSVRPTPDGKTILFLRSPARSPEQSLYAFDVATGKTRTLLTPAQLLAGKEEQLSPEERARRERMRVTARGFAGYELSDDGTRLLVTLSGRLWLVELGTGASSELPTGAEAVIDPRFSPDASRVAFVRDRDLYVLDLAKKKETRLTKATHPRVSNGLAEFIAQEELDRMRGYWWSPEGDRIGFEEADSRPLETFHLSDPLRPERVPEPTPYPRPGKANAIVRLGVVSLASPSKPVFLEWDRARFPYLASVVWKNGPLTLVVLSRDQRDLEVLAADPLTGKTTRLLAEHDDAWLNLDQSVPRWLEDKSGFLWSSERSGAWQLELRDAKGALVRAVTAREHGYRHLSDVDGAARTAAFEGGPDPTSNLLYKVSLDGSEPHPLSSQNGTAVFAKNHHTFVMRVQALDEMPRSVVFDYDKRVGELERVAEDPPLRTRVELLEVGTQRFNARVIRPLGFKAGRKYPVVVDVYGGPHHLTVTRSLAPQLLPQWIAEHGFIVVSFDGRGTPARGREWERALRGRFGTVPLDDQVEALRALAARVPEMDLSRVGVSGWSFGGYMAALAVLRRPDVFHAGVAGAPVVDWRDYDTAYTERYLGLPDDKKADYDDASLLTHAAQLSRPLLLVHGTRDDNVYFFHTLKLAEALLRAGKRFDLLPLPGLTHMVPDPQVRIALHERILSHLSAALKP